MRIRMTTKTQTIGGGFQPLSVVQTSDGNYRGTWAYSGEGEDDEIFLRSLLEDDDDVVTIWGFEVQK